MIKNGVRFLRKLLEFSGRPLTIEFSDEVFSMAISGDYIEIVHVSSREYEEVVNPTELVNFVRKFHDRFLLPVDSDLYVLILKEVMKAAHEQTGMTQVQMTVLVGALSETTDPEETMQYLRLINCI